MRRSTGRKLDSPVVEGPDGAVLRALRAFGREYRLGPAPEARSQLQGWGGRAQVEDSRWFCGAGDGAARAVYFPTRRRGRTRCRLRLVGSSGGVRPATSVPCRVT